LMHSTAVRSSNAPDEDQRDVQSFAPHHFERFHALPLRQIVVGEHYIGKAHAELALERRFGLHHYGRSGEAVFAQNLGDKLRVLFVVFDVQHSELPRLCREIVSGRHEPLPGRLGVIWCHEYVVCQLPRRSACRATSMPLSRSSSTGSISKNPSEFIRPPIPPVSVLRVK